MVKFSEYFLSTLKETPADSDIPSYALSLRAGLIKRIASGIYSFMPIGLKVLKKIENIIREEMDKSGAVELLMPAIQPSDLWMESKRWFQYGPELFRLKDRNNREFCLGPTHEELITSIARQNIKSYKDMPVNLYQIQVKFRDEIRPRYGILRAREFIMKDAYSFTANEEDLDKIYLKMHECYSSILKRLQLKYFAVEADTGLIGGKYSHEFIILAKNGEDTITYCPECGYAANFQMANFKSPDSIEDEKKDRDNYGININSDSEMKEVFTPDKTTIKMLSGFLKADPKKIIKTMLLKGNNKYFAVLVRGDKELNIAKVEKSLGFTLDLIDETDEPDKFKIGFIGPVGLDNSIKIFADNSLKNSINLIAGANIKNYHYVNVNFDKDFNVDKWGDFSFPSEGDLCFKCGSKLKFEKGIEIGHIFKLGTKYSEKMNTMFLDRNGELKPVIMGCYGIGVSRIISAAIEQLSDESGIIWPLSISPFLINIIAINVEDPEISKAADEIYGMVKKSGVEVIFDDRNVRAGVKFKDSDLLGIPIKLIVGKNYIENQQVEIELRKDRRKFNTDLDSAMEYIKNYPQNNSF